MCYNFAISSNGNIEKRRAHTLVCAVLPPRITWLSN